MSFADAARTPTAPASTTPVTLIQDIRRSETFLPVEVGQGNSDDQFWLISVETRWYEAGRNCVGHQLLLRCRHCNFGYNSNAFVTVRNLVRMGEEAGRHVGECQRTGRTLQFLPAATG